jgi:hypothetical protein
MREITTKVYKFDELSDEVKRKVIDRFADVNVEHTWWDYLIEDAARAGLSIESFDLASNNIHGDFDRNTLVSALYILQNHGPDTRTYKTAKRFFDSRVEMDHRYFDADNGSDEAAEYWSTVKQLNNDLLEDLLDSYREYLQTEYDFLTSEDSITGTIRASEIEFLEDGSTFKQKD